MPPGSAGEDDEFEDLRKEDVNAMVRLFLEYGRGQRLRFAVGGVASVTSTLMELVPAFLLGVAIDAFLGSEAGPLRLPFVPRAWLPTEAVAGFFLVIGLLGTSYVVNAVMNYVNSWAWNGFAQHFQHNVRVDAYDAMQRRELSFFDDKQTGEVMSILNNDVNQLEGFLTNSFNTGISIVFRVGGMGAVMLLLNWRLGIVPTLVIPVLGYASYVFVNRIHPKYQEVRSSVGALNSRLENNLGGIEVVKSYTTEGTETDRVEDASEDYLDAQWDAITTRIKFWPTLRLVTSAGYTATFLIGGYWVMANNGIVAEPLPFFNGPGLTAGLLVTFLGYSRRFVYPMRQFGQIVNDYQYAQAAGERIVGLLDREPGVTDADDAVDLGRVEGHVEYDDVDFSYETEDGTEQVLDGVSFAVDPGEMVGLVGPTGAGKTTLMKLLMRLYDVDDGSVRVDGHDVRDVTLRSLRGQVGYVSQEPFLFTGSIRENIAYGMEATDREIEEAARRANADEFITDLEDGYETEVGQRGDKLSGGQRQRIAIARAILRDPPILVLDEATSHVDNETEVLIQRSMEELIEDRTTFAIAHRLSTVRHADRILVMEDGEVVERGTHDDLLATDGLYANLWSVQVGEVESLPEEFLQKAVARDRG